MRATTDARALSRATPGRCVAHRGAIA